MQFLGISPEYIYIYIEREGGGGGPTKSIDGCKTVETTWIKPGWLLMHTIVDGS